MRKQKRFTAFLLILAILVVQVMQVSAETGSATTPTVVCSDYTALSIAVMNAQDGDVIGIDSQIYISGIATTLGNNGKHITIVRMNDGSQLLINASGTQKWKNITLDGNYIAAYSPFVICQTDAEFENVTFKNCQNQFDNDGGAITISGGASKFYDCTFQDNKGVTGGHLFISNDSVVNITGSTFTGGLATKGGAIYRSGYGSGSWTTINDSTIKNNTATASGGGIYSDGIVVLENSKVFANTAPVGEDITDSWTGNTQNTDDLEVLQQTFADENITVKGWITTTDDEGRHLKFDYEENADVPDPTPSTEDPGTGDEPSTQDPSEELKKDDTATDSSDHSDRSTTTTTTTTTTDNSDHSDHSDHSSTTTDHSTHDSSTTTTDNSTHDSSTTTNTDSSSHDTITNTDNSDHSTSTTTNTDSSDHSTTSTSTTNTDNSVKNTDSGNTSTTTTNNSTDASDRSQRTDNSKVDNSSTTYNYYQQKQPGEQIQQPQSIVIHNYIQPDQTQTPASDTVQQVEQVIQSPSDNIRIDAKNSDVTFEVVDSVYSISINGASEPAPVAAEDKGSNVNWYKIVKIALLAALVINQFRRPRKDLA